MARGERDFKLSILTDVETAALEKGADKLDEFGDQAKTTATKIDGAFEKIAASSRANVRKVDADLDRAGKGLDDFRDEAGSTGREAAASFSGSFDDVADGIQEVAANAFAGFGPAGAAAGMLAAAGLGVVLSKVTETKEKVADLRKAFTTALVDDGAIGRDLILDRLRELADDGVITQLAKDARAAKIDVSDYLNAVAGDPEALARVRGELEKFPVAISRGPSAMAAQIDAANDMRDELGTTAEAHALAAEAADAYTTALGTSAGSAKAYAEALTDVGDGSGVMASAVEAAATRQANATSSTEDAWTDYRDTALASIDDVIAKQLEQLTAAEDFEANTATVLARLGQDAVDWALSQGENADKAMQLLASAPLEKGEQVVENYRRLGRLTSEGYAGGMSAATPAIGSAAEAQHAKAREILGRQIDIPTALQGVTDSSIWSTRRRIQEGIGTIEVPIMLRGVTPSKWSTSRTNP